MSIRRRSLFHFRRPTAGALGLAPDPATTFEPVVQVYGARCAGIRGVFAIHTWIAVKGRGARSFTVYEVIGRRARVRGAVLTVRRRSPDTPWSGNAPELLADKRGDGVDALISRIDEAARAYPYAGEYVVWPGPNSNTFTAYIALAVPELDLDLPLTAIGKNFLRDKLVVRRLGAARSIGPPFSLPLPLEPAGPT